VREGEIELRPDCVCFNAQVDVISYNKALQACVAAGQWLRAQDLVKQMLWLDKIKPDRLTHMLMHEILAHARPGAVKQAGSGGEPEGVQGQANSSAQALVSPQRDPAR
jgi:pentatricopeptide repeat protein